MSVHREASVQRHARFSPFVLNVGLSLAWAMTTGAFSLVNLIIGFVLAFLALWLPWRMWGDDAYFRRPWRIAKLIAIFVWELVASAVMVARLVFKPGLRFRSAIVAIPLDVEHDFGITLFANLISLTPGTLSIDVSDDRSTLYVHAMASEDPEGDKDGMKRTFERRIQEMME